MRIAIDIDSTLHHYWDQLREVVLRRHGIDLPYEAQTTWAIAELPQEAVAAAVRETHEPDAVLAAVPYPGAVETVRAWHEAGHFIHVTSHRAAGAAAATERWLRQVGLPSAPATGGGWPRPSRGCSDGADATGVAASHLRRGAA